MFLSVDVASEVLSSPCCECVAGWLAAGSRYLFMKLLPEYALVAPARPRIVLPKKSRKAPLVSLVSRL